MYLVRKTYGSWDEDDVEYILHKREPDYADYIPVMIQPLERGELSDLFKGE